VCPLMRQFCLFRKIRVFVWLLEVSFWVSCRFTHSRWTLFAAALSDLLCWLPFEMIDGWDGGVVYRLDHSIGIPAYGGRAYFVSRTMSQPPIPDFPRLFRPIGLTF